MSRRLSEEEEYADCIQKNFETLCLEIDHLLFNLKDAISDCDLAKAECHLEKLRVVFAMHQREEKLLYAILEGQNTRRIRSGHERVCLKEAEDSVKELRRAYRCPRFFESLFAEIY